MAIFFPDVHDGVWLKCLLVALTDRRGFREQNESIVKWCLIGVRRHQRFPNSLRDRLASSDGMTTELSSLKQERDVIRTRVTDMLEQLEALSL